MKVVVEPAESDGSEQKRGYSQSGRTPAHAKLFEKIAQAHCGEDWQRDGRAEQEARGIVKRTDPGKQVKRENIQARLAPQGEPQADKQRDKPEASKMVDALDARQGVESEQKGDDPHETGHFPKVAGGVPVAVHGTAQAKGPEKVGELIEAEIEAVCRAEG